MSHFQPFSAAHILNTFTQAISRQEGKVTDTYQGESLLLVRSVLPHLEDVRPKDPLRGGIAMRATENDLYLHPYLFRLVCKNGAILAQSLQTRHLADLSVRSGSEVGDFIDESVETCSAVEVFTESVGHMSSAADPQADGAINAVAFLATHRNLSPHMVSTILKHFLGQDDRTRYGLVNAITATARETRNPRTRWELEELGGALAVLRDPVPEEGSKARAIRRAVLVH